MEITTALDFARTTRHSVFTTLRRNGRPQLSNVFHAVDDDGTIRISVTADRAKYKNLARTPWAALQITQDDFYAYVVIEGDVTLSAIPTAVDDPAQDDLVQHYQSVVGEHPDWDAFREAQITERRSLVRLTPTHVYGMLSELPAASGT